MEEETLSLTGAFSGIAVLSVASESLTASRIVSDDVVPLCQLKRHAIVVVAAITRLGEPIRVVRFAQVVLAFALERIVRFGGTVF